MAFKICMKFRMQHAFVWVVANHDMISTKSCFKFNSHPVRKFLRATHQLLHAIRIISRAVLLCMQKGQTVTISSLLYSWFLPMLAFDNNQKIGLLVLSAHLWSSCGWNILSTNQPRLLGNAKSDDPEDPAALVGSFKRYKNWVLLLPESSIHVDCNWFLAWMLPLFRYSRCLKFASKTHTPALLIF